MAFARIRVEAKQTISSCGKATAPVSAGATGNGTIAASGPASVSQPQSAAPVNAQSASSSRDSSPQRYSLPARGISSPGTLAARHRVASADDLVALASRMSRSTAEPAAADNAATPKDAPNAPGAAASTGRASRSPARDVRRASVIRGAGNACGSSASASGLSLSPGHRRSQSAIVLSLGTRVNEGAAAAAEDITMAVGTTAAGVAPGDTETRSPDQQHHQQQQQVKPFNRHGSDFRVNGTKAPDDPSRASSFACEPLPPPQHQQPAPMSPPLVPRLRLSPLPSTSFTSTFASTLDSTSNFSAAYASTSSAASALSSSSVLPPLLDSHPSARQLLREEQRAREVAASVAAIARSKGLAPPPTPTHAAAAGAAAAAAGLSSGDAGLSAEWASGEPRVLQTAAMMTDPEATASAASMPVSAEVRATETVPLVASQQQQQILIRRLLPLGWQLNGSPLWRWAEEGLSRQQSEQPLEQFEQWDAQEVVSAAGIGQRQRRSTAPGPRVGPCPAAEAQLAASAAWASAAAAPAADGGGPGGAFQPAAPGCGAAIVLSTAAESSAVASSDVGGAGEAHASAASVLYSSSTTAAGPAAVAPDPAVATDATCNGSASVPSPGPVALGHPVSQPSGSSSSSGRLFTPFMRPTAAEPFFLCMCTPRAAAADDCGRAMGAEVQQPAPGRHGRDQAQWPAASDAVTGAAAVTAAAESSTLLLPVPPTPDGMGPRPLRLVPSLPAAAASCSGHGAGGGFGFGFHRLTAAPLSRLASAAPLSRLASAARPGAAVTRPVAGAAAEAAAGAADGAHAASTTADGSGGPEVCAMVAASAAALRRLRRLRNLRRTLTGGGDLNVFRIRHYHHHDAPGATGVSHLALTTAVAGAAANVLTLLPGTGGLGSALSTAVSLSSAAAAMTRAAAAATANTDAAELRSPEPFHQEQHSSSHSGSHRGALLRPGSRIWGGGGGGSGSVMALVAKALADVLAGQGAPPSSRQALRRRVRAVVAGGWNQLARDFR